MIFGICFSTTWYMAAKKRTLLTNFLTATEFFYHCLGNLMSNKLEKFKLNYQISQFSSTNISDSDIEKTFGYLSPDNINRLLLLIHKEYDASIIEKLLSYFLKNNKFNDKDLISFVMIYLKMWNLRKFKIDFDGLLLLFDKSNMKEVLIDVIITHLRADNDTLILLAQILDQYIATYKSSKENNSLSIIKYKIVRQAATFKLDTKKLQNLFNLLETSANE